MANVNDHGLFQLLDLGLLNPNQTANTSDSGLLISAMEMDRAQHNADIESLMRLFAFTTNDFQLEVRQSGSSRSQPLDESGRAIPIKPPVPYTVAFPLQASGSAWGANYVTQLQMTNRELASTLATMYRGDYNWVRDQVLGHLYQATSYTHTDITGKGSLTINGLANSDAVVYYSSATNSTATDSHLLAQAAAIADATNPYPVIVAELREHPANTGEVISLIPTASKATTIALAEFRSATLDADIQPGPGSTASRLVGNLNATLPPGSMVLGKTDSGSWIVEWPDLPTGFIISFTSGGPRPLARRVFAEPALQGFRPMGERNDFPYFEEQWARWEGYAGYNRVGAVIMRTGNGTYAVPTNYGVPMP
jgi:hypothetical protein